MNVGALQNEFDGHLAQWDRHIDGCHDCLSQGEYLCYEGEWLSQAITEVRLAVGRVMTLTPPARPIRGPERPIAPGMSA